MGDTAGNPSKLLDKVAGRLPTAIRIFREASVNQPIKSWRSRQKRGHRCGFMLENRADQAGLALTLERLPARDRLIYNFAERENVGSRVGVFTLELFGSHVLQRSKDGSLQREGARVPRSSRRRSGRCHRAWLPQPGQAKVQELSAGF